MSSPWKHKHTHIHKLTHIHSNSNSQLTCQCFRLLELRGPRSTKIPYNQFAVCRFGDKEGWDRGEERRGSREDNIREEKKVKERREEEKRGVTVTQHLIGCIHTVPASPAE